MRLMALLFLLHLPCFLNAQGGYYTQNITSMNGLPQNSVKNLTLDKNGFLWISTESGLVRYDGARFQIFNTSNDSDLVTERIQNVFGTPDERLFVNDAKGSLLELIDNQPVLTRKGAYSNSSWLNIHGGISNPEFYKWIISRMPFLPNAEGWGLNPTTIIPLNKHQSLVKIRGGLQLYTDTNAVRNIDLKKYKPWRYFMLKNRIFFINEDELIYEYEFYNHDSVVPCALNFSNNRELIIKSLKEGKLIWEYCNKGAFLCLNNNIFEIELGVDHSVNIQLLYDKFPENCVLSAVLKDTKNQILYLGTDSRGLLVCRFRKLQTITFDTPEPGTNNAYYSQIAIDSNTIFSSYQREFSINGAQKSSIGISRFNNESIAKDKSGNIYFNRSDTLFKYERSTGEKKFIYHESKIPISTIVNISDTLFVGNSDRIRGVFNDHSFNVFPKDNSKIQGFNPNNISKGPDQRIWIASCSGLFILSTDLNKMTRIPSMDNICVRSLFLHGDKLFIGTYGKGYYIWQNGKLFKMPIDIFGHLNFSHSFQLDGKNNLYISTNHGLFRIKMSNLDNYLKDPKTTFTYWYYGELDGINNIEFNGGCSPSSLRLSNGYFTFPTMEGFVFFNPDSISDPYLNYPIFINQVKADRKLIAGTNNFAIPSNTELVEILINAPFWGNKENLRLEYKLSGFNKNWIPLGINDFTLTFSNLESGSHELIIRKKSNFDAEQYVSTSVILHVKEKYYETIWFKFLVIIFSGLLLQLILHLYGRNIRKRNQQLEDNVKRRTLELQDANQTLEINNQKLILSEDQLRQSVRVKDKLISIISHDIIAPLKFISLSARLGYGKLNQKDPSFIKETMQDISGSSEKLFDNAVNMLNWIKFQNNRIDIVMHMESPYEMMEEMLSSMQEMAKAKNVELINTVSMDDVLSTDRRVLSIILQNMISNSIRFTENGVISISSMNQNGTYCIIVTDTGSGMNPNTLEKVRATCNKKSADIRIDQDGRSGSGLGYLIIAELMELLKGNIVINSEEGKGTVIEIYLPLT